MLWVEAGCDPLLFTLVSLLASPPPRVSPALIRHFFLWLRSHLKSVLTLRLYYIPRRQLKNLCKRKSEEWETNSKSEVRACPSSFRLAQADFKPQPYLYKYPSSLLPAMLLVHITCENGTVGSETSAREIQTPGNHPKERIQHMI